MPDTDDRLAIRELIERFHDAINHRAFDSLGGLFTEDAVWEVASPFDRHFTGRAAIVAGISESVGRLEFLFQSCSPIVVEFRDGGRASARTSMQEFGRFMDGTSMRVVGTYLDSVSKTPEGWRFTRRRFEARYADDVPLCGRVFTPPG